MTDPYVDTIESGHAWLGRIPSHWQIAPLGTFFAERNEIVSDAEFQALSVTKAGVVPQVDNVAKTDNNDNRKLVRAGDIAINSRSDRKGASGLSSLDGSVSVVYTVLTPRSSIDGRFAHHLLRSEAFQEEFYRWGNGIVADLWSTRFSAMKRIPLAAPPLPEQRGIADYLDHEMVRIDTLIEEQQRLIDLLRERREATIADAVIGPETVRLRRLVDPERPMTYGILQCGEPVERGVPYIGPSDMPGQGESPTLGSLRRTTAEIAAAYRRSVLAGGDVVVSIGPAYGKVAVVDSDLAGSNLTQDTVRVASIPSLVDSRYLVWALLSRAALEFWDLEIMGATFRRLNLGTLARTPIPLPTLDEQRRIAAYLDERTSKVDGLIAKTERVIDLARERRAALITAAVTGKIDVRAVGEPVEVA